jgi:hypothetical protein
MIMTHSIHRMVRRGGWMSAKPWRTAAIPVSLRAAAHATLAVALFASTVPAFAQSASEKLDALDKRITRLEDMNQIERLQRTYGYFVDKSQWRQLAELFSDDATLEIGGKGIFTGKPRVLEYMQTAFGMDGAKEGSLANHMQFQSIPDISADGKKGWIRSRAYVMSLGGWGLPLYENEYRKENGVWKISRLTGPFTMYTNWEGWGKNALNNTWPDKFDPPPDLPPSTVYLTYPAYYIIPFHYPNPVTGKPFIPDKADAGAYQAPPGTKAQADSLKVGRLAIGTQPIMEPPRD